MNENISTEEGKLDFFAIVEVMGRQVIAGKVTEQVIGGTAFIRVDVPEMENQPAFTRFYSSGAIYAITPVSEEVARLAVKRFQPEPVTIYIPELRQLTAPSAPPPFEPEEIDDSEISNYDPSGVGIGEEFDGEFDQEWYFDEDEDATEPGHHPDESDGDRYPHMNDTDSFLRPE